MTSIEWFIYELEKVNYHPTEAMVMYAKKLHKQEIIDAYRDGRSDQQSERPSKFYNRMSEQYYQETFVSKGSDDHISDISKMVSDEEIEKAAIEYYQSPIGNLDREIGFRYACKWYREQLKIGASKEK